MKKFIKKLLKGLLKLIAIVIIIAILILVEVYIVALLEINKDIMTEIIMALGFTLTIINLWDKFVEAPKDKTVEENSKIIVELLKEINEKYDKNQKILKENIILKDNKINEIEEKEYEKIK